MGTHGGGTAQARHPIVRVLLVVAGVILLVAGGLGALFMIAFLFFSGTDLMQEVGSTGEGSGGAITGLIAVCGMIAFFGFSLIRPDDRRPRRKTTALATDPTVTPDPAGAPLPGLRRPRTEILPRSPIAGTAILVIALVLAVATVLTFVLSLQLQVNALLGCAFVGGILQLALGIVGLVLSRTAEPTRRRRYRIAGVVSAIANPLALIVVLILMSTVRELLAPR